MEEKGVSRRDFYEVAVAMTAMLTLPSSFSPLIKAATLSDRLPIIWLHIQRECTDVVNHYLEQMPQLLIHFIFDYISLEYHETLMATSGWQAEHNLESAIENIKGRYILMVEVEFQQEKMLTFNYWWTWKTGEQSAIEASNNALAICNRNLFIFWWAFKQQFQIQIEQKALSKVTR